MEEVILKICVSSKVLKYIFTHYRI